MFVIEKWVQDRWIGMIYVEGSFRDALECVRGWGVVEETRIRRITSFLKKLEWHLAGRKLLLALF